MNIPCPNCKTVQYVPKEYMEREVKCVKCKQLFSAKDVFEEVCVVHQKKFAAQEEEIAALENEAEPAPIKCPQCGSAQIAGGTKGFSGGKAVGFAILAGPVGLLAGLHGSKRIVVSCLNCGHKWQPGK